MRRIFKSRFFRLSLCVLLALTAFSLIAAFTHRVSPDAAFASAAAGPVQGLFAQVRDFVSDFASAYTRYTRLQEEYDALSAENARLSASVRQAEALLQENEALHALDDLRAEGVRFRCLPARVIAAASDALGARYTLSVGSRGGAEDGMCAVTAQGLVGFVTDCTEYSCTLLPLACTDEGLSACCARSGAAGILQGDPSLRADGLVRLSFIDKNAELFIGDVIETAGLGGACPAGIAIGLVTETGLAENALSRYAVVRPLAELDGVRRVFLVAGPAEE